MVLPFAGNPTVNRRKMSLSVISQAVRSRTSWPQRGDRDQTAFSGAFCPETVSGNQFFKFSGEKILKSDPGDRRPEAEIRKSGFFSGNRNTYVGRGGKRISLYMINGQKIVRKAIDSFQTFIGWIAFPVYRRKLLSKLCGCKHAELLSYMLLYIKQKPLCPEDIRVSTVR